ncbi:hypothetical protein BGZ68_000193 [Mortierella alpina]|nr:hypothetical protein BGZ68_000193 [Mortierella alpina]
MKRLSFILAVAVNTAYGVGESIPLTNDNNAVWYGSISVGTPPNSFNVVFDTGRADLILPGKSCKSGCDGHTQYEIGASSTAQELGKSFNLAVGEGSVISGEQVTDTVSIGGFTASEQTLGIATSYPPNFQIQRFPADGILGMAFGSISAFPADSVMETLKSQNKEIPSVFAFKLAETDSELMVGGTNDKLYTGGFTNVPVTKKGYWQTTLDAIVVNEKPVFTKLEAVIDTGSTTISLTLEQAQEFYATIGGKDASAKAGPGFYSFPCESFPSVALTFGGKSFKMSEKTFSLGKLSQGSNECVGSIVAKNDAGMDAVVIGTAFLQNVYTAFDLGNNQIGFADLAR